MRHHIARPSPGAPPKMSEQLGAAARPWLDRLPVKPDKAELEFIYNIVGLIWNASRERDAESALLLAAVATSLRPRLPGLSEADVTNLVREIHDRARRLFPDDPRVVVKVSMMEMSDGLCHVVVASAVGE